MSIVTILLKGKFRQGLEYSKTCCLKPLWDQERPRYLINTILKVLRNRERTVVKTSNSLQHISDTCVYHKESMFEIK